ncbi:MAG: response regulator transcription factor [Firmicutes bacterium]|nr:response regulator transcription factor [Candidatus Fermentithermobacillaceae bacterium]
MGIRILLVDPQALIRKGISALAEKMGDFDVVGEASNGEEALQRVRELQPDVVVMEIYLPRLDGIQAAASIKSEFPGIKVVFLTVSENEQDCFEALKVGADGYILKTVESHVFFKMLSDVCRGEPAISPVMAGKVMRALARGPTQRSTGGPSPALTAREKEVLKLVAQGATNREISEALFISENTVKNHLRSILSKLQSKNRAQAASYALQQGIISSGSSFRDSSNEL